MYHLLIITQLLLAASIVGASTSERARRLRATPTSSTCAADLSLVRVEDHQVLPAQVEYLFCALRDRVAGMVAELQATVDEQAAALGVQQTTCEQAAAQTAAAHQQQLRALRCAPAPVLPFADVTGDFSYGGNGLTVTCHDGYADNGATSGTLQCTTAGTWEAPDGAPMLDCASIDPCSLDEDDCDALADCAHTGPATHECECTSETFGTGHVCSQCSPACDIGQVQTAPCTSTADIACEAVIASEVLPDIDGATLTYSNEQSYPTTATYACGDNEMSRTLQPDGTWSAAGELSCGPTWILGAAFDESCDTICAAEGLPCTDGDWGVIDQASLEAALAAAGQSSSDRASLCSGDYAASGWAGYPGVRHSNGGCRQQSGATTSCSASHPDVRRLCRCA